MCTQLYKSQFLKGFIFESNELFYFLSDWINNCKQTPIDRCQSNPASGVLWSWELIRLYPWTHLTVLIRLYECCVVGMLSFVTIFILSSIYCIVILGEYFLIQTKQNITNSSNNGKEKLNLKNWPFSFLDPVVIY